MRERVKSSATSKLYDDITFRNKLVGYYQIRIGEVVTEQLITLHGIGHWAVTEFKKKGTLYRVWL